MEGAEKVKVVVRCRPISTTEKLQGHKIAVTCNDEEKAVNIKSLSQEVRPDLFQIVFYRALICSNFPGSPTNFLL